MTNATAKRVELYIALDRDHMIVIVRMWALQSIERSKLSEIIIVWYDYVCLQAIERQRVVLNIFGLLPILPDNPNELINAALYMNVLKGQNTSSELIKCILWLLTGGRCVNYYISSKEDASNLS